MAVAIILGLAKGERVRVRTALCSSCSEVKAGAVRRLGTIVRVVSDLSAYECPSDHKYQVVYNVPWNDGKPGRVLAQYFAASELELIGT